jgi:hypothetical protein
LEPFPNQFRTQTVGGGLGRGHVVDGQEQVVLFLESGAGSKQLQLHKRVPVSVVGRLERGERANAHHHPSLPFVAEEEEVMVEAALGYGSLLNTGSGRGNPLR